MQRTLRAGLLAGLMTTPVLASESATYQLDEVVVTATRTARTADASLASVTVIRREDIERGQARTLADVVEGLAGVSLSNQGGAGKVTSLFLRGAAPGHVVVLVDGVRIGSATLGTASIQDLPLALIDRVEIVRGPASGLYGSDAIGGVIQVFTRRHVGAPALGAMAGYGAYGTRQASAELAGGGRFGWYSLGLSHFDSDGFNARVGADPDADGYRNRAINLRGGLALAPGLDIELTFLGADGKVEYDGYYDATDTRQQALGVNLDWQVGERWQSRLSLGQARDQQDNFAGSLFMDRTDTRRLTATWQNDLELARDQHLTLGLERQRDEIDSSTDYNVRERVVDAVFGQYQGRFGRHDLRLALRHDDNSQFGGHATGNLAWGMDLDDGVRLMANLGTGFRAPTFNDLYYPWSGNPTLRPETSRSAEIGVSGRLPGGRWAVNAHATRVRDLIDWECTLNCADEDWTNDIWQPGNINAADIRGVEGSFSRRWLDWSVRGVLTLLDPENATGPNRGKVLIRRARQSARLDLDRDFGAWSFGATLRAEGPRYDDQANTVKLSSYALLDLRGAYRLAKDWRIEASLANVFDQDYQSAASYNQPGRGAYLVLRYRSGK
jgi:vitamin B12 transporter